MPFFIHDNGHGIVVAQCGNTCRDLVKEEIRTGDCSQFAIVIYRYGTHDTDLTGENVRNNVREKQSAAFRCSFVPVPFGNRESDQASILSIFRRWMVVCQEHHAIRQSNITGTDTRIFV